MIGDDAVALSPIPDPYVHAGLAVAGGAALAGAVYGISYLLQKRLMTRVQALLPKT